MKVSCIPVSFFTEILNGKMSMKEWAHIAAEAGLDAIDISIMFIKNHTPVYLNSIRKEIESEGMFITMVATYPDFSHPDSIQREREMEYLRHDVALTSNLGAKYLRILAGQAHPGTLVKEGIKWVVENFKEVSAVGDKFNVKLLFENHSKPGAWDYTDFSHPTEIFLEIAEGIRDTSIGINFDTGNTLVYGDDPIPVLKLVIDKVETIHAADMTTRGKLEHAPLGEGIVPFKEIFSLLKQNKFDGWICMEEASNTGKDGVKKAMDFVQKTWSEV
ncbi:MAG: sugar phosphate isomerase/epimerase family protein [Clostridiales bacterium]|nr:sugar phosphate isomerase/epimerase family protein [Clostridiales bacterium]